MQSRGNSHKRNRAKASQPAALRPSYYFLGPKPPDRQVYSCHTTSIIPRGGCAPFLEVLQYQVDAWSGRSKLLFQLPAPKIHLIYCPRIEDVSDIKLIRTDTTLDLSQKAEKRCRVPQPGRSRPRSIPIQPTVSALNHTPCLIPFASFDSAVSGLPCRPFCPLPLKGQVLGP